MLFVVGVLVARDARDARHGAAPDRRLCGRRVRRRDAGDVVASPQRASVVAAFALAAMLLRRLDRRRHARRCSASARYDASPRAGSRASPRRSPRSTTSSPSSPGSSAPRRPTASASARRRGAASRRPRGCSGVPAQIHSDYTFTALVGVFGPIAAWAASLGGRRLAAPADPPPRPRHARRAAPGRRRRPTRPTTARRCSAGSRVAWVVLTSCQLAVTVAGNLAVLPLTGVTFPFVSFGMTSLLVNIAFLALCLNVDLPARRAAMAERALGYRCSTSRSPRAWRSCRSARRRRAGRRACARPTPTRTGRAGRGDRYVSVRHVAALKTFERAIVRARRARRAPHLPTADVLAGIAAVPARVERADRRRAVAAADRRRRRAGRCAAGRRRSRAQLGELDAALLRFGTRTQRARRPRRRPRSRSAGSRRRATRSRRRSRRPMRRAARFRVRCADLAGALGRAAPRRRGDARRRSPGAAARARRRSRAGGPSSRCEVTAARGDAAQPVGRHRRLHLPRRARDGADSRRATSSPARAARSSASARLPRSCAARRGERRGARAPAPTALGGEPRPADAVDDPRWMVPPSLVALLQPLETLRQPTGALYRAYADGDAATAVRGAGAERSRNRVVLDGAPVDVGYSVDLDDRSGAAGARPEDRRLLHRPPRRLPRARACAATRTATRRSAHRLLEGAMVRMAAVAVIDVASGRIEALAGALSPCARQEVDGPGRDAGCDARLPYSVAVPRRRAAQPRRLPRRDAGLDDQADHGGRLPRRRRRTGAALLAAERAGHAARRRAARATACAAS